MKRMLELQKQLEKTIPTDRISLLHLQNAVLNLINELLFRQLSPKYSRKEIHEIVVGMRQDYELLLQLTKNVSTNSEEGFAVLKNALKGRMKQLEGVGV